MRLYHACPFCAIQINFSLWSFIRNFWPFTDPVSIYDSCQSHLIFKVSELDSWKPLSPSVWVPSELPCDTGESTLAVSSLPEATLQRAIVSFRGEEYEDHSWALGGTRELVLLLWPLLVTEVGKYLKSSSQQGFQFNFFFPFFFSLAWTILKVFT